MKKEYPKDGIHKEFYPNGQKKSLGNYKDGKQEGKHFEWHENGKKKAEYNYINGKLDGRILRWHDNGIKKFEASTSNGEAHGKLTSWFSNGQKERETSFNSGKAHGRSRIWGDFGLVVDERLYRNGELVKTIVIDKITKLKNEMLYDERILNAFDDYLESVFETDPVFHEYLLSKHGACGFDTVLIEMSMKRVSLWLADIEFLYQQFDKFRPLDLDDNAYVNDIVKDNSNTHIDEHTLIAFDRFLKQVSDTDPVYYKSLRSKYDKGVFNDRLEKLNGITDMADLFDEFGEF
jgi:hypothetical protein